MLYHEAKSVETFEKDDGVLLASTQTLIEEARVGHMFILVDDEGRENEGDLVIPAQFCDAAAVNFMARFGRGLICLAITEERRQLFGLPMMNPAHELNTTAFTVSIEAREGVTTGISAVDRATTITAAVSPSAARADLRTPGHVFPLVAREGGVLVRPGHTEASVDLSELAGLSPAAVICEIMNDDGTMARMPDLIRFALKHGLRIGTIADLIEYRKQQTMIAAE